MFTYKYTVEDNGPDEGQVVSGNVSIDLNDEWQAHDEAVHQVDALYPAPEWVLESLELVVE